MNYDPSSVNRMGELIGKNIIIRELEDALTGNLGFRHVRDGLYMSIGEVPPGMDFEPVHPVNQSEFLDSINATVKEYLSKFEETEFGEVRIRSDYIEEQLRMLAEDIGEDNRPIHDE